MDLWQLILYAGASLAALHSLVSLMSDHRRRHRRQLLLEYQQQSAKQSKSAKRQAEQSPRKPADAAA